MFSSLMRACASAAARCRAASSNPPSVGVRAPVRGAATWTDGGVAARTAGVELTTPGGSSPFAPRSVNPAEALMLVPVL